MMSRWEGYLDKKSPCPCLENNPTRRIRFYPSLGTTRPLSWTRSWRRGSTRISDFRRSPRCGTAKKVPRSRPHKKNQRRHQKFSTRTTHCTKTNTWFRATHCERASRNRSAFEQEDQQIYSNSHFEFLVNVERILNGRKHGHCRGEAVLIWREIYRVYFIP